MEHSVSILRKRRRFQPEYKELAARSCYSVIMTIGALVLLRPVMVDHILSRANAYSHVGRLGECRRQCDKALLVDGESSEAWLQMARLYLAKGSRDMACGAFQKAVQADALNAPAHFELGVMYVEDGRHKLAIPHFDQVRHLGRKKFTDGRMRRCHQTALDALASCYERVGDHAKAEFTLEEIRVYYPGACDADARLARLKALPSSD